jgi:5'-nucleotidase
MADRMTIFLTNDDGIDSPGLLLLAEALREEGHRAVVLAPQQNRSGVSHCISFLNGPLRLKKHGEDTWSCSGYPVDCVVTSLLGGLPGFSDLPDMVLSGINRGANIGTDITYSGTAAAARQAGFFDVPSIALSLIEGETYHWDMAVSWVTENLSELRALWRQDTFLNINIPNNSEGPSGLVHTFPSLRLYRDTVFHYEGPDKRHYCFYRSGETETLPEDGSDWDAVARNLVSASSVLIHPAVVGADGEIGTGRERRTCPAGIAGGSGGGL